MAGMASYPGTLEGLVGDPRSVSQLLRPWCRCRVEEEDVTSEALIPGRTTSSSMSGLGGECQTGVGSAGLAGEGGAEVEKFLGFAHVALWAEARGQVQSEAGCRWEDGRGQEGARVQTSFL